MLRPAAEVSCPEAQVSRRFFGGNRSLPITQNIALLHRKIIGGTTRMKMAPIGPRAIALSLVFGLATVTAHAQSRQIPNGGSTTPQAAPLGGAGVQQFEIDSATQSDSDSGNDATGQASINRKMDGGGDKHGHGDRANGKEEREEHTALQTTFDGLNFHDQRFANNGNQFSVEPPDQGLCAGNGFVLESVNDVLRVYDTNGNALINPVDLNTFYGYPAAIARNNGKRGPSVTDPSCYYDNDTQRWFHVVLTLDHVGFSASLSGKNHLDLAVSTTSNPLGAYNIYRIPVQDDGTDGTPNHQCAGGPCLGDYPHIGADRNGIYLTTNEFNLFAPGFRGAQLYALSKKALAAGAASVALFQFDTGDINFVSATGFPGFAVIPATSPGKSDDDKKGGTEYLLSSTAVFQDAATDKQVQLWAFTDTNNLNSGQPPILLNSSVATETYGIPSLARQPGVGTNGVGQKPGGGDVDWPLGQCLNDVPCATTFLLGQPDPFTEVIGPLAGDDSRMKQVYFANGEVWGALGTGISFDGTTFGSDGIAYFIIKPKSSDKSLSGKIANQGYVATPKADITYPTFGVTSGGKAIISFTLMGLNDFPGLAYVNVNDQHGAGDIHFATHGVGAQDGFSEYKALTSSRLRPRWGDYGATAVVGNQIFAAQEYIGQSCTLAQYVASNPFGTCGGTRAALGNWGTRIARFSTEGNED